MRCSTLASLGRISPDVLPATDADRQLRGARYELHSFFKVASWNSSPDLPFGMGLVRLLAIQMTLGVRANSAVALAFSAARTSGLAAELPGILGDAIEALQLRRKRILLTP